jgi:hypothetical protein
MRCNACSHENSDQARYCEMCGADLKDQRSYEEKCIWYYMYKQIPRGPFSPDELIVLYQLGVLENDTLLSRKGLNRWVRTDEVLRPNPQADTSKKEDYYIYKEHKTLGPYTRAQMENLIQNFGLDRSDQIWQPDALDWVRADESDFVDWYEAQNQAKIAENTWYILENEVPVALSKKELIAMIEQGAISAQEQIWTPVLKKWVSVENSVLAQYIPLSVELPTSKKQREWIVWQDGQQKGPFSLRQVENFIASGTIHAQDQVYREGMAKPLAVNKSRFVKELESSSGWYLMENEEASGPFEESDMASLIRSGSFDASSLAWCKGMSDWKELDDCAPEILERHPQVQNEPIENQTREQDWYIELDGRSFGPYSSQAILEKLAKAEMDEDVRISQNQIDWVAFKDSPLAELYEPKDEFTWFYARNEQPYGPYSEKEMKEMFFQGYLEQETWVWKHGLADWVKYKNSALAY